MGLYPLHRVLMENKLGRPLERWEVVHHINEDKTDDRIENLGLMTNNEHSRQHQTSNVMVGFKCAHCQKIRYLKPSKFRQRRSKNIYCSKECSYKRVYRGEV